MKSEHRHELQQNELGKVARKLQPWFARHGMQVVWAVAAVLIISGIAIWWTNQSLQTGAAGWTKLSIAQNTQSAEDYAAVAEKNSENLSGVWARLRSAELNLDNGILESFTDRELSNADLKRAKEDLQQVLATKIKLPDAVQQRAMFDMARCVEATCDGNTAPVVEAYQALLTRFPDSIYQKYAEQRIKDLQSPEASHFYTWFHKQNPKPPEFKKPQDAKTSPNPFDMLPPSPGGSKPEQSPQ